MVNVSAPLNYNFQIANLTTGQTVAVIPGGTSSLAIKVGDVLKYIFSAWARGTSVQIKKKVAGVVTNEGSPITIDSEGNYTSDSKPVTIILDASVQMYAEGGGITSGTINLTGTPEAHAVLQTNGFPTAPVMNTETNFSLSVRNDGYGAGKLIIWIKNQVGNPGAMVITLSGASPGTVNVGSQVTYLTAANISVNGLFTISGTVRFSTKGEHIMRIAYGHKSSAGADVDDGHVDVG